MVSIVRKPRYNLQPNGQWVCFGRPPVSTVQGGRFRLSRARGSATGGATPAPTVLAGSVPVGTATYAIPGSNVRFIDPAGSNAAAGSTGAPWKTLQYACDNAPSGSTIVMRAGVYREAVFHDTAGSNLTIQAAPGEAVWLDGSVPLTSWTQSGSTWSAPWTYNLDHSASFTVGSNAGNFVGSQNPMAAWPEQVWVNDSPLYQVPSTTTPAVGQFCVDNTAQTITIGTNPAGKTVVAAALTKALHLNAPATVRGIGVRRYATGLPVQGSLYVGSAGAGSVLENIVVRESSTQGIYVGGGTGTTVRLCTAIRNGSTGIAANNSINLTVDRCVMADNNQQQFNMQPTSAGIKVTRTRGVRISQCVVRGNINAAGIWLDVTNIDGVVVNNRIFANFDLAIHVELCERITVAGNSIDTNGGAYGLAAFDSGNCQFWCNRIDNARNWYVGLLQDERRNTESTKTEAPWITLNTVVANNVFSNEDGVKIPLFQLYIVDKAGTGVTGEQMVDRIAGNIFSADPGVTPLQSGRMCGWGNGGGDQDLTIYKTPAALAAAKGAYVGANTITATPRPSQSELSGYTSLADPIPAAVATAMGVPAGSRIVGPVPSLLPTEITGV